jgi:hypothetical protein
MSARRLEALKDSFVNATRYIPLPGTYLKLPFSGGPCPMLVTYDQTSGNEKNSEIFTDKGNKHL